MQRTFDPPDGAAASRGEGYGRSILCIEALACLGVHHQRGSASDFEDGEKTGRIGFTYLNIPVKSALRRVGRSGDSS